MEGGQTYYYQTGFITPNSMLLPSSRLPSLNQYTDYGFYSEMTYPTTGTGLCVLPLLPFHVSVDSNSLDINNNPTFFATPCNNSTDTKVTSNAPANLRIFGKSRNAFLQDLAGFCKSFHHDALSDEWASSAVGAKLCNKIFLDNDKQLYVLVMDDVPDSFRISKPEAVEWNKNGNQEEVKLFNNKVDEKLALKCSVDIGKEKFAVFLFSPMNISFQVRMNGNKIISLYYHGKVTEEVKLGGGCGNGTNFYQKQITIEFHDDNTQT